jgi:hypothetical protein
MSHLTLAQVYVALTYYHVNLNKIEADLAAADTEYWNLVALRNQKD